MGKVFICYRREDTSEVTGRIYDRLVQQFSPDKVFKDVDNIAPGEDFRKKISIVLKECEVVLVVIGDRWMSRTDTSGPRRLDNVDDLVRVEIETALRRDVRVIPLLVRGAIMPKEAELPESMEMLAYRNAIPIRSDPDFNRDMDRLIGAMKDVIESPLEEMEQASRSSKLSGSTGPPKGTRSVAESLMRYSVAEIAQQLNRRVCGQEMAIRQLIPWIKRLRFGLPRDGVPAVSFLMVGPTDVGQIELTKELARLISGDEEKIIRISLQMHASDVSGLARLVGAPPGYVGYGEGVLTNTLRDSPESIILFDEIEKASPEVRGVIMSLLNSGFVQDPAGPIRDARKAILVFTTNAGQDWLLEEIQTNTQIREDAENLRAQLVQAAKKELSSLGVSGVFWSRVDDVLVFLPFSMGASRKIMDLALERELVRLKDLKGLSVNVDEQARDLLTIQFYHRFSTQQGACAAPRVLNEQFVVPIIDFLSEHVTTETEHPPTHLVVGTDHKERIRISSVY